MLMHNWQPNLNDTQQMNVMHIATTLPVKLEGNGRIRKIISDCSDELYNGVHYSAVDPDSL